MPAGPDDLAPLCRAAVNGVIEWSDFAGIIGDDWGAPPRSGQITGTVDGEQVDFSFGIGKKPRRGR
jgi:hypothetical protein